MAAFFLPHLLLVLALGRAQFLDFRYFFISGKMKSKLDVYLWSVLQGSLLWTLCFHLTELVFYFHSTKVHIMLVAHHVCTVLMLSWIMTHQFINGYVMLPLTMHFVVSLDPFYLSYSVYVGSYLGVMLIFLVVVWRGAVLQPMRDAELLHLCVMVVLHVLVLLQFGRVPEVTLTDVPVWFFVVVPALLLVTVCVIYKTAAFYSNQFGAPSSQIAFQSPFASWLLIFRMGHLVFARDLLLC